MKRKFVLFTIIAAGLLVASTAFAVDLDETEWEVAYWDSDGQLVTDTWCIDIDAGAVGTIETDVHDAGGITVWTNFFGRQKVLLNFPGYYLVFYGRVYETHASTVIMGTFVNYITGYHGTFIAVPSVAD
ncbi:hypothetical protein GF312_00640 [Candidatus Poribacteria bacterium]|nr:hypothetical protein [Candidatus Poribacteria bacterium]